MYLTNFESRSLAEKYGKRIYAMDQDRDRFAGFYHGSKWRYGDYRWFAKRGGVRTTDDGGQFSEDGRQMTDDGKNRRIELEFYCRTPGLEEEPVVLTVSYDGRVLDEVVFPEDGGRRTEDGRQKTDDGGRKTEYTVVRKYELPVIPGEELELELLLEVSRTWIPHEVLGNFDRRELGVGVKLIDGR